MEVAVVHQEPDAEGSSQARTKRTKIYKALLLLRQLAELSARVEAVVFEARHLCACKANQHLRAPRDLSDDARRMFEEEKAKRMEETINKTALSIIKAVMQHKYAYVFNTPVDTVAYPDYLKAVKTPMDLGTIRERLESGKHYKDEKQVWADVCLVFSNARLYNPPGSDVHIMAQTVAEAAEDRWEKDMPSRLASEQAWALKEETARKRAHAETMARHDTNAAQQQAVQLVVIMEELFQSLSEVKAAAVAACDVLSQDEAQALGLALKNLPAQQLQAAVQLVAARHPNALQPTATQGAPDMPGVTARRLVLALDEYDPLTLRQLQLLVSKCSAVAAAAPPAPVPPPPAIVLRSAAMVNATPGALPTTTAAAVPDGQQSAAAAAAAAQPGVGNEVAAVPTAPTTLADATQTDQQTGQQQEVVGTAATTADAPGEAPAPAPGEAAESRDVEMADAPATGADLTLQTITASDAPQPMDASPANPAASTAAAATALQPLETPAPTPATGAPAAVPTSNGPAEAPAAAAAATPHAQRKSSNTSMPLSPFASPSSQGTGTGGGSGAATVGTAPLAQQNTGADVLARNASSVQGPLVVLGAAAGDGGMPPPAPLAGTPAASGPLSPLPALALLSPGNISTDLGELRTISDFLGNADGGDGGVGMLGVSGLAGVTWPGVPLGAGVQPGARVALRTGEQQRFMEARENARRTEAQRLNQLQQQRRKQQQQQLGVGGGGGTGGAGGMGRRLTSMILDVPAPPVPPPPPPQTSNGLPSFPAPMLVPPPPSANGGGSPFFPNLSPGPATAVNLNRSSMKRKATATSHDWSDLNGMLDNSFGGGGGGKGGHRCSTSTSGTEAAAAAAAAAGQAEVQFDPAEPPAKLAKRTSHLISTQASGQTPASGALGAVTTASTPQPSVTAPSPAPPTWQDTPMASAPHAPPTITTAPSTEHPIHALTVTPAPAAVAAPAAAGLTLTVTPAPGEGIHAGGLGAPTLSLGTVDAGTPNTGTLQPTRSQVLHLGTVPSTSGGTPRAAQVPAPTTATPVLQTNAMPSAPSTTETPSLTLTASTAPTATVPATASTSQLTPKLSVPTTTTVAATTTAPTTTTTVPAATATTTATTTTSAIATPAVAAAAVPVPTAAVAPAVAAVAPASGAPAPAAAAASLPAMSTLAAALQSGNPSLLVLPALRAVQAANSGAASGNNGAMQQLSQYSALLSMLLQQQQLSQHLQQAGQWAGVNQTAPAAAAAAQQQQQALQQQQSGNLKTSNSGNALLSIQPLSITPLTGLNTGAAPGTATAAAPAAAGSRPTSVSGAGSSGGGVELSSLSSLGQQVMMQPGLLQALLANSSAAAGQQAGTGVTAANTAAAAGIAQLSGVMQGLAAMASGGGAGNTLTASQQIAQLGMLARVSSLASPGGSGGGGSLPSPGSTGGATSPGTNATEPATMLLLLQQLQKQGLNVPQNVIVDILRRQQAQQQVVAAVQAHQQQQQQQAVAVAAAAPAAEAAAAAPAAPAAATPSSTPAANETAPTGAGAGAPTLSSMPSQEALIRSLTQFAQQHQQQQPKP